MFELLTVTEAAARLKMTPRAVYAAIARRQLPFVKLGARRVRLRPSDLERLIQSNAVEPETLPHPDGRKGGL